MPYIKQEQRKKYDGWIDGIPAMNDGEFNYVVTRICHEFILQHGLRYWILARVFGGLICVMFELYRRVAARYEDRKIKENGGISTLDGILRNKQGEEELMCGLIPCSHPELKKAGNCGVCEFRT